jgi:ribosomal protein S10
MRIHKRLIDLNSSADVVKQIVSRQLAPRFVRGAIADGPA